jgi:high-affinity iron transporter
VLAFQAVGREGLETMVFTLAIVFASTNQAATHTQGRGLLLGALLGLAVALAVAYALFKLGRRLNLGLFFRVVGVVLMVFAAGLLADAVENMQQLGWLPFLDQTVWNSTRFLSEDSSLGDVFHSLLGYADHPTVLQVLVWVIYVVTSVTLFVTMGRRARRRLAGASATGPTGSTAAPIVSAPIVSAPAVSEPAVSGPAVSGPAVSGPAETLEPVPTSPTTHR